MVAHIARSRIAEHGSSTSKAGAKGAVPAWAYTRAGGWLASLDSSGKHSGCRRRHAEAR